MDLSHSVRIARVETVRGLRKLQNQPRQLIGYGIFLVFFGPVFVLGGSFAAYTLGPKIVSGEYTVPRSVRASVAGVWGFIVFLTAMRVLSQIGEVDNLDGMLTTVTPSELVPGVMISEFMGLVAILWAPVLPPVFAFLASTGAVEILAVPVLALPFMASAVCFGYPAGMLLRVLVTQVGWIARHKIALGIIATFGYFAFLISGMTDVVEEPMIKALNSIPLTWYTDSFTAFIPGVRHDPALAAGAFLGILASIPIFTFLGIKLASYHWYSDRAETREKKSPSSFTLTSNPIKSSSVFSRPTRVVMMKTWIRSRRSPVRLIYVIYPLFALYQPIAESIRTGEVSVTIPVISAVYLAWAAGAAFTLNPLGDEGSLLPVTLTTPVSGKEFTKGRVIAGAIIGVPAAVIVTGILAFFSPLDVFEAGIMAFYSGLLTVFTTVIAAGIGSLFPKFESTKVARNTKAVVPSLLAFAFYSILVLIVAAPGLIGTFGAKYVGSLVSGDPSNLNTVLAISGVLITGILGFIFSVFSYNYAVNEFDGYTID